MKERAFDGPATCIAYLAPELPALSATFVYEELLALERLGVRVIPFSVHWPSVLAPAQDALRVRTQVLYGQRGTALLLSALDAMPRLGLRAITALTCLVRDMLHVRLWRLQAWKLAYQWLAAARFARMLLDEGCAHLHVHFAHVPTQIAMYASAFSGIPFTIVAHANDIFERGLLLPQKARRSVKMLTISQYNADYLRSVGVPADALAVVRCGVTFAPRSDIPSFEVRDRYRIGTLGRLVQKKGIDDLLHALALLPRASWQWELSIAGDGPLRMSLEALALELGIGDRVSFEGALPHERVRAWMHGLDVFVLACKPDAHGDMDGIPVVLMEAMSQRIPVVSTRLSGIPELVVHEQTGLLASPGSPVSVAEQLRRLLQDPELRRRLTAAAAHHVDAEFGQPINLERLMTYLPQSALPTQ